tara:strand:- start:126 stop:293 length:168 start_codon:yes stop_codon:yes gene_type:complete
MSGVRYHQITDEKWCNEKRKTLNDLSYKEHIKKLDFDDKIIFEMENTSKNAIKGI